MLQVYQHVCSHVLNHLERANGGAKLPARPDILCGRFHQGLHCANSLCTHRRCRPVISPPNSCKRLAFAPYELASSLLKRDFGSTHIVIRYMGFDLDTGRIPVNQEQGNSGSLIAITRGSSRDNVTVCDVATKDMSLGAR